MDYEVCYIIVDLERSVLFTMVCDTKEFNRNKEKFQSTTKASRFEVKLGFEIMKMKGSEYP